MIQNAVILSTGDEITSGKVVDTNANYLSDKLVGNWNRSGRGDYGRRRSRPSGMGMAHSDRDGRRRDLDRRHRTDRRRPDHRNHCARRGREIVARRGRRRTHEALVCGDWPPNAREQSQAGAVSRGCDGHPESARHGARLQDAGDDRRPYRASDRPARRAPRNETDDGKYGDTVDLRESRHQQSLRGSRLPDFRDERVGARRSGGGIDQTGRGQGLVPRELPADFAEDQSRGTTRRSRSQGRRAVAAGARENLAVRLRRGRYLDGGSRRPPVHRKEIYPGGRRIVHRRANRASHHQRSRLLAIFQERPGHLFQRREVAACSAFRRRR